MNAFQQARGTNIGQMNQLSLKSNSLQATIARLLEIGINYTDAVERKNAEVTLNLEFYKLIKFCSARSSNLGA